MAPTWFTVFSSMFLHGGFMHLIGNMLYLWIFGNNVEDSMGHRRFVVFYLACGVIAALGQSLLNPRKQDPHDRRQWRHLGRARRLPAALPACPSRGSNTFRLYLQPCACPRCGFWAYGLACSYSIRHSPARTKGAWRLLLMRAALSREWR